MELISYKKSSYTEYILQSGAFSQSKDEVISFLPQNLLK